jgi:PKHD-type hydroxylase
MSLENYYWYFKKALPKNTCENIIKTYKNKKFHKGTIGVKDKAKANLKTRNTNVVFIDEPWLYREIQPFTNVANRNANWNFNLDWTEKIQFGCYRKNSHYDWHCDSTTVNKENRYRKVSTIVMLSNPSDYEGGQLKFQFRNNIDPTIEDTLVDGNLQGNIIVFPSYVWHKVEPVTKGVRYSLVTWTWGPPFK